MLVFGVVLASCAAEQPAPAPVVAVKAAPPPKKAVRKLSPSEQREKTLLASIDRARAKKAHPRELSKVEADAFYEIAKLRFERNDEPGAVTAIELAIRQTWFVEDASLFPTVRARELEIKRAIAMRTAERGNYLDALGILDQLTRLDRLTPEDHRVLAGDRFVVLDKLPPGEQDISEDVATLDKLTSVSILLEEPPSSPEVFATETRTGSAPEVESAVPLGDPKADLSVQSGQLEKREASAALLAADDMPLVETGTIDLKTVSQMLALHRRSIESCFSRALRAGQKPSGKLEVDIAVQTTGDVSDADIKTREFSGTELGRCVASAVRRWKFPPIEEAKRMTVPFVLGRAY